MQYIDRILDRELKKGSAGLLVLSLVEHRARLAAVLEARGNDAAATLQNLQAWCKDAEASGIRALEDFSARLKGYRLHAA